MRIAAIDIGTNTILMLLADADSGQIRRLVRDEHAIARLGKGVDGSRRILPETVERVAGVLNDYAAICRQESAELVVACGTSALRDAANRDDVITELQARAGISVRILSGVEEAELTYRGAVSDSFASRADTSVAVLDIGGGSTEVILGSGKQVVRRASIDVGAVRVTERFLKHSPPLSDETEAAERFCREAFSALPPFQANTSCIAVAGTPTTLAALELHLPMYDPFRVEGLQLTRVRVDEHFDRLKILSHPELLAIHQIHPQRADILLAGIIILRAFCDAVRLPALSVSDRGLRYGILLDASDRAMTR
jgi:exopolyphosphatase/guanosine-5'-triphosphate,3'-diphosphate pyrophosphatase